MERRGNLTWLDLTIVYKTIKTEIVDSVTIKHKHQIELHNGDSSYLVLNKLFVKSSWRDEDSDQFRTKTRKKKDKLIRFKHVHFNIIIQQVTCFKIKHLNKHECGVHPSYSKWVLPLRSVTFLLVKKILERFLQKSIQGSRFSSYEWNKG